MLTNFLSNKYNINILMVLVSALLTYTIVNRFNCVYGSHYLETGLVLALIVILCVIVHIKGIAKGMLSVKDDLLIKEFLKAIKSNADKTTKK